MVSCHEFLTYLYDRPQTRELAMVLAAATLQQPIAETPRPLPALPALQALPVNAA